MTESDKKPQQGEEGYIEDDLKLNNNQSDQEAPKNTDPNKPLSEEDFKKKDIDEMEKNFEDDFDDNWIGDENEPSTKEDLKELDIPEMKENFENDTKNIAIKAQDDGLEDTNQTNPANTSKEPDDELFDQSNNLNKQGTPQAEEYDPKYDDRYKANNNLADDRDNSDGHGGGEDHGGQSGGGGGHGGGEDHGGQSGGGGGHGGGEDHGGQSGYDNYPHKQGDEGGGGGGGHDDNNRYGENSNQGMRDDAPMHSDMLRDMPEHGSEFNEPPAHAAGMTGWDKEMFPGKLDVNLYSGNINAVASVISGSLDTIGAIADLNEDNAFGQDIAGIGDGTFLSQGNIAHEEIKELAFEGLGTQLDATKLPTQLAEADSFGGFKHSKSEDQAQSNNQAAMNQQAQQH